MSTLHFEIFTPGKIPVHTLLEVEEFKFPYTLSYKERIKEIEIDRMYNEQSIHILSYQNNKIVASVKIIPKNGISEKLPIEFSTVKNGGNLELPLKVNVCEIGGLKIEQNLSYKNRYVILNGLFAACGNCVLERKFKQIYISCKKDLYKFYKEKMFFKFLAEIFYGREDFFALSRTVNS